MSEQTTENKFELLKGDKVLWSVIILISFLSVFPVYSASSNLEYIVNKWAEKNRIESTGEETKADESFAAIASNLVTNWENEGLKSKFIEEIKNGNGAVCDEFAYPERTLTRWLN